MYGLWRRVWVERLVVVVAVWEADETVFEVDDMEGGIAERDGREVCSLLLGLEVALP